MRLSRAMVLLGLLVAPALAAEPARPLPDPQAFLREARKRLQPDEDRQREYSYVETRREIRRDDKGQIQEEDVTLIESYPGFPGEDRWERVIAINGTPVPPAELEKTDRQRAKDAQAVVRKLQRQTASDRDADARERAKRAARLDAMVDDVYRLMEFTMTGRDRLDGHDTIAFTMTPRPNVKPQTRMGGMMRRFRGRVWLSESEYELAKLEVEAMDTFSFGLGVLARIHQGSRFSFQRRPVDGHVWLPAKSSYRASARVLLLKRYRSEGVSEYSNYRKFTVDTSSTYTTPTSD